MYNAERVRQDSLLTASTPCVRLVGKMLIMSLRSVLLLLIFGKVCCYLIKCNSLSV